MQSAVRKWASLALLAAALAAAGCTTNRVSGQMQFNLVSASEELALGDKDHPAIIFMYNGEYHDPELNRYLGSIVMRLHQDSHRPDMPTEFTMVNSSVINAFAIPGHVYATRGFLARLQNEAQFAAVMGHELAHVAAGHSASRLSHSVVISLAGDLVGSVAGSSAAAQVALSAGQTGVTLLGLSYSREQETQADRVGTYYMALAGWDPRQAVAMQLLLQSLSQHSSTVLDRYLSTHPMAADRVAEIESIIKQKRLERYVQGDGVYADRWNRHLAHLREVDKAYAPYDKGMKAIEGKQYGQALEDAEQCLNMRTDQAPFYRLKGDALLGMGRTREAKAAYDRALRIDPRYVFANLGLANAYKAEGDDAGVQREVQEVNRQLPGAI